MIFFFSSISTSSPSNRSSLSRSFKSLFSNIAFKKAKRQEILAIAARHGARNVRVFGSVARGEAKPESDIDILVEMESGTSLMDHVTLMQISKTSWKEK